MMIGRLTGERLPLDQSGRASFLVRLSIYEMSFLVEVVVDAAVHRGELLQGLHPSEAQHGSLPSAE
jgi:hypothetical protein